MRSARAPGATPRRDPSGTRVSADQFSAVARAYARYRPSYPAELFAALARAAPGRRAAWDCATGTGQAATGLAAHLACTGR